jgi:RHS repeat-associated protein
MYPVPLVMRPAAGTMVVLPSTMLIEVRAGHVLQDPVIRLAPTASMPPNQPTAYAGADSAAPNLTFTYDGDGLRAGTTRTPSIGGAPSTTAYVWDTSAGLPVLLQAADNQYLYGPDARPYAQIDRPNRDITYLHADALGSTDNTGTRVATWTYDAYGNTTTHTGTVPVRRRIQDSDTGLYYLRARYYDPTTATFHSRDPSKPAPASPTPTPTPAETPSRTPTPPVCAAPKPG